MSEHDRTLAEAIHHEMLARHAIDAALSIWRDRPNWDERQRMWAVLAGISSCAIDAVLTRRLRETARTGPWQEPAATAACREERERCARHIEAHAIALRDHGPTTAEGVLTAIAGAQVGALLDAAADVRAGRWGDYEDAGSLVRLNERQSSNAAAGVIRGDGTDTPAAKSSEPAPSRQWGDYEEEDGYPGSLVPKKRTP